MIGIEKTDRKYFKSCLEVISLSLDRFIINLFIIIQKMQQKQNCGHPLKKERFNISSIESHW